MDSVMSMNSSPMLEDISGIVMNSPTNSYLPPFLLGYDTPTTGALHASKIRPDKQDISILPSPMREYNTPNIKKEQQIDLISDTRDGPPIKGLLDFDIEQNNSLAVNQDENMISLVSTQFPRSRTEGNAELWVTIFGFTASKLSRVLSHFSQYGNIRDTKYPPNGGNWVHVRYTSKVEVNNALSRNGKRIEPNIMVGVVICNEVSVTKESNLNRTIDTSKLYQSANQSMSSPRSMMLPNTTVKSDESNINENSTNRFQHSSVGNAPHVLSPIRLLNSKSPQTMALEERNAPVKSTGFFSKTLDILGW